MPELVTIARYPAAHVAELARGYLRANGIESVLQDAESVTMRAGFPTIAGLDLSVRLQVVETDIAAARAVLAEWELARARASQHRGRAQEERCLQCDALLPADATACAACGWTWETEG